MMIPIQFMLWCVYKISAAIRRLFFLSPYIIGIGWLLFILSPYAADGMHWLYLLFIWAGATAFCSYIFLHVSGLFIFIEEGMQERFGS
jgi:hypothetical protein